MSAMEEEEVTMTTTEKVVSMTTVTRTKSPNPPPLIVQLPQALPRKHFTVLAMPFLGKPRLKTVIVPGATVEAEPATVRTSKTLMCSYKAITEDLRSRTIVKQESGLYKEEQSGAKYRQVQLQRLPIGSNLSTQDVTAIVKTPSGGVDLASIGTNPDGSVGVRYDPKEEGVHELHVKIKGDHIQGSPFKLHVDSLTTKKVTAYGSGLTHGVTGEISNFLIALNNNTGGGLQVAIDGPSKAEITIADNKDGTVSVNYLPTQPGEYQIVVRFGGEEIAGSPFIAQVTGEAKRKSHSSNMPTMTPVLLKLAEKDIKNLTSTIVTPAGIEETATVKKLPNGSLGVSFTPKQSGQHFVNVKRGNNHIVGSPFIINVLEREIADATKVKLSGQGLKEGKVRVDNDFLIDTRDSGYGGLSLSVEGPSKAEISGNQIEDGILRMTYRVNEPGFYVVMVKFADNHVPGSPLTVKVVA
ncbi:Filamin-A [Halotydeus destructor]|nr:Filamin-A [Halotydeus destructor]